MNFFQQRKERLYLFVLQLSRDPPFKPVPCLNRVPLRRLEGPQHESIWGRGHWPDLNWGIALLFEPHSVFGLFSTVRTLQLANRREETDPTTSDKFLPGLEMSAGLTRSPAGVYCLPAASALLFAPPLAVSSWLPAPGRVHHSHGRATEPRCITRLVAHGARCNQTPRVILSVCRTATPRTGRPRSPPGKR